MMVEAPVAIAHHIDTSIPAADAEYWRRVHGDAWLNCIETLLMRGVNDPETLVARCTQLSLMAPRPMSPWGNFNPFDNPYKHHTIQAPNITF